ncbi:hypothetical protein UPYG_G00316040 [Umbra pygmaea]|uniref:RRM domain-containing protein n=1 Tax=Umbra pygmaea TaxID=75934 RepID=A0ABD0WH40_UMBPY
MWYPLFVPYSLPPEAHRQSDISHVMSNPTGIIQMNTFPYQYDHRLFLNAMYELAVPQSFTIEDGRRFLLNRSVFDLVKATHFLELTDPKLLGWYLSLPVEDRKLIQEEGGLHQFLRRHPALEIARQLVYVKKLVKGNFNPPAVTQMMSSSNLDSSRRPSFYGVIQCTNCGTSCSTGGKKCRRCNTPIQKIAPCEQDRGTELSLLPNHEKEELNLFSCSGHGGVRPVQAPQHEEAVRPSQYCHSIRTTSPPAACCMVTLQDSFHSACAESDGGYDCAAEDTPGQQGSHFSNVQLLHQQWEEVGWQGSSINSSVRGGKDPDTQASLSLDTELEMQSARHDQGRDVAPSVENHSADIPTLGEETPLRYYSFHSTTTECTEGSDTPNTSVNTSQSSQLNRDDFVSLMATEWREEQCSRAEAREGDYNELSDSTNNNRPGELANAEVALKYELQHDNIMKEDGSILMYKATNKATSVSNATPPHSQPNRYPSGLSGESLTSPQSPKQIERSISECSFVSISPGETADAVTPSHHQSSVYMSSTGNLNQTYDVPTTNIAKAVQNTADRSVNTPPLPAKRDMSVGTDQRHQHFQIKGTDSADKNVITEVRMADLDYVAEEYIKLKFDQEELNKLKVKMASSASVRDGGGSGDGSPGGCDCTRRATQAELSLLALQYGMCQQHCWRRYYTSREGDSLVQGPEPPTEDLLEVLQDLETDYQEMRRQVLSGVSLEQIPPLSVDSQKITSAISYTPALIFDKSPGGVLSGMSDSSSHMLQGKEDDTVKGTGEKGLLKKVPVVHPDIEGPGVSYEDQDCGSMKAVSVRPQQPAVSQGPRTGEPNSTETWYDAEENLRPLGAALLEGSSQHVLVKEENGEMGLKEKQSGSLLCVTGLSSDVTKGELMLWFEKYQATEVNIVTFSNDLRVALVIVSDSNRAERAVDALNGCSRQGHTLRVQHIFKPSPGIKGQGVKDQLKQPGPSTCTDPESSGVIAQDSKKSNACASIRPKVRQSACFLPRLNIWKRTIICDSPTASGTCVPQHYATMGSFDTVMARLSERHPDVGRQRIVNALLELRAKHQGFLSGLPLRTIVDMTSDLLTQ